MASVFAALLSLPLAVAGAQNLAPRWLNLIIRIILNAVCTLPNLVWALLAVAVVGPKAPGVIGLTFYSIGYLSKFFSVLSDRSTPEWRKP